MTTIQQFLQQTKQEYELIQIEKSPRSHYSICNAYMNQNVTPEDKALEKDGSEGLRKYFNSPNLRKRKLLESGKTIKFQNHNTRFIKKSDK